MFTVRLCTDQITFIASNTTSQNAMDRRPARPATSYSARTLRYLNKHDPRTTEALKNAVRAARAADAARKGLAPPEQERKVKDYNSTRK